MQRTTRTIRTLLAASLLVAAPWAQGGEPAEPSPSGLLERAAFAELHERDPGAAKSLYAEALEAAEAAGATAVATEARVGLARVGVQLGEVPREQLGDDDVVANRIALILERFLSDPSPAFEAIQQASRDLKVFGDAAVPILEQAAYARPVAVGTRAVSLSTDLAVHLLYRHHTAASIAAMYRLYEADDPFVRRAVISYARGVDYVELSTRAASDPVLEVRENAWSALSWFDAPGAAEILREGLERGHRDSIDWYAKYAPEQLLEYVTGDGVSSSTRATAIAQIQRADLQAPTRRLIELYVDLWTLVHQESSRAASALEKFAELEGDVPGEITAWIEGALLARSADVPRGFLFKLLNEVGSIAAFEWGIESYIGPADGWNADEAELLVRTLAASAIRIRPEDFARFCATLRRLPAGEGSVATLVPRTRTQPLDRVLQNFGSVTPAGWSLEEFARENRGMEREAQAFFLDLAGMHVQSLLMDGPVEAGSIDRSVLPLALDMLRAGQDRPARGGLVILRGIGDPENVGLAEVMRWNGDGATRNEGDLTIQVLRDVDPEGFPARVEQAWTSGVVVGEETKWPSQRFLDYVSNEERVRIARAAWPSLEFGQRFDLASYLIRDVPTPASTELLVELYPELPKPFQKNEALLRFGRELHEPAVPLLGEALRDSDEGVRAGARQAFQMFKQQREAIEEFEAWQQGADAMQSSIRELTGLLASEDREVRLGAVKALGAVRARTALPELVRMLATDDVELRAAIDAAIARMAD